MTVFAHPDDETFGAAGTIRRATNAGCPVAVVCATRGEAGEIADPSLATKDTLGSVRAGELRRAMAAVGAADVRFLDYRDGRLPEASPEEAVTKIVRHLREFKPDVVVTFAANGGYGHVDHMAIHHLALAALTAAADPERSSDQPPHRIKKLYYAGFSRERMVKMRAEAAREGRDYSPGGNAATIPIEEMGTPDEDITTRVVLSDGEFAAKMEAARCHATQLPATSPWLTLPRANLRAFMGVEAFQLVRAFSDRDYTTPEDDLFAGL
jgi:LmbE family N-acetylglucosaminyl deacetylase